MYSYTVTKVKNVANVSTDRVLKLIPGEGGARVGTRSTFNINMFKGDKQLHAVQDSGLWYLLYKSSDGSGAGNLPEPLRQRWTNFNQLMKFLIPYFESRNVKIEEVVA